ncbi:hypothetical protein H6A09_05105 [[Clostridium] spiroforme]|nr:hypothetical protein [Thomasclavelia spiroformis]
MNKKTAGLSFIGNVIIGFGISILNLSGLGLDAFTAMNYGVSQVLGVGLGIYQACFNLILLIPIAVFYRRALGVGTLINMFLLGYFVEIFMQIFALFQLVPAVFDTLIIKLILLAIGFVICNFGAALYMECQCGMGIYDCYAPFIEDKTHIPFQYARIATDFICAMIGFIAGQQAHVTTIGVATVIFVMGTGPMVQLFRSRIMKPFLQKLRKGEE